MESSRTDSSIPDPFPEDRLDLGADVLPALSKGFVDDWCCADDLLPKLKIVRSALYLRMGDAGSHCELTSYPGVDGAEVVRWRIFGGYLGKAPGPFPLDLRPDLLGVLPSLMFRMRWDCSSPRVEWGESLGVVRELEGSPYPIWREDVRLRSIMLPPGEGGWDVGGVVRPQSTAGLHMAERMACDEIRLDVGSGFLVRFEGVVCLLVGRIWPSLEGGIAKT